MFELPETTLKISEREEDLKEKQQYIIQLTRRGTAIVTRVNSDIRAFVFNASGCSLKAALRDIL